VGHEDASRSFESWTRRYRERTDPDGPGDPAPLIPAATVVLVRDGHDGLEVLMVKRNAELSFAGGMWVFPGGRVDPGDIGPGDDDERAAARRAAVREAAEETDLTIDPDGLVELSHWTPPPVSPKRFGTWFFVGEAPATPVTVDGGEILTHQWATPRRARELRDQGQISLSPPTWITLEQLDPYDDAAHALAGIARATSERFTTRIVIDGENVLALYHGDHAYETGEPGGTGPVHRLTMGAEPWLYERTTTRRIPS
jgi:8-oxo-dGTP pyrophosphatase MutT (NUDIX family)